MSGRKALKIAKPTTFFLIPSRLQTAPAMSIHMNVKKLAITKGSEKRSKVAKLLTLSSVQHAAAQVAAAATPVTYAVFRFIQTRLVPDMLDRHGLDLAPEGGEEPGLPVGREFEGTSRDDRFVVKRERP